MDTNRISYRAEEAFEIIGVARSRGYDLIRTGELKSYLDGRLRMVSRRALESYVAAREKQSQDPKGKAA